jgi:hypothetical protein
MLFVASHAKVDIDAFRQEQTANVFPSSSLYAAKKPRYRSQKERELPKDVECNTIINVTSKRNAIHQARTSSTTSQKSMTEKEVQQTNQFINPRGPPPGLEGHGTVNPAKRVANRVQR